MFTGSAYTLIFVKQSIRNEEWRRKRRAGDKNAMIPRRNAYGFPTYDCEEEEAEVNGAASMRQAPQNRRPRTRLLFAFKFCCEKVKMPFP